MKAVSETKVLFVLSIILIEKQKNRKTFLDLFILWMILRPDKFDVRKCGVNASIIFYVLKYFPEVIGKELKHEIEKWNLVSIELLSH